MFGIYLHIPFCEKKCVYCDFYSVERTEQMQVFIEYLLYEIQMRAEIRQYGTIDSIFLGGGTPSLLPAPTITRIIDTLANKFNIAGDAEITMECNPGTVTLESLRGYKDAGVNRLSFGIQSFHQSELSFLGRIHTADEARDAVYLARKACFDNVNIDLMFALPSQTLDSWRETLREASYLQTEHISAYSLIYEEGTPIFAQLAQGRIKPADESEDSDMYAEAIELLSDNGFIQYEVSNFAQKDKECRHNLLYWNGEEYLAFGPSAHGFIDSTRYWNYRNISKYNTMIEKRQLPIANTETLEKNEKMYERIFLELRAKGIRLKEFQQDFGIDISDVLGNSEKVWRDNSLIKKNDGRLSLTSQGYAVCDELTLKIIAILEKSTKLAWKKSQGYREDIAPNVF